VIAELEARARVDRAQPEHLMTRRFRVAATAARHDVGEGAMAARAFAEALARRAGGVSLADAPRDHRWYGKPVARLADMIASGTLRPGMVIMLDPPGHAASGVGRPHWLTYLGRAADGTARFADPARDGWSLGALLQTFAQRPIVWIADPHAIANGARSLEKPAV
jgi:hypothetical protein